MEFHVLELPKLPEELKEDPSVLLLWAKFINAERKEEFDMLATKSPYINHAYQHLQIISQDKEKRLEYEAREKALRDHNQFLFEAEQRGREEGREIGKQEEAINIAQNMISLGIPDDIIIKSTKLSAEQMKILHTKQI